MIDTLSLRGSVVTTRYNTTETLTSCCNDPGCNCLGGRQAREALEKQRLRESEAFQVQLSQAAQERYASEKLARGSQAVGDVQGVVPLADSEPLYASNAGTAKPPPTPASIDTYA